MANIYCNNIWCIFSVMSNDTFDKHYICTKDKVFFSSSKQENVRKDTLFCQNYRPRFPASEDEDDSLCENE